MEPEELASALVRLKEWAEERAPEPEAPTRRRLREHLGREPAELPIVSRSLEGWDRPNFQVAVDEWALGREVQVLGLPVMQGYRAGLAELVHGSEWMAALEFGAATHVAVPLGERENVLCVESGVWLVRDDEGPLVLMLKSEDHGMGERLALEIMVADRERGERVLGELWTLMRARNVYRGRVLELRGRYFHGDEGAPLTVRALPSVARDQIVLPPECWSGSNVTRSASRSTLNACGQAVGTSAAGCFSYGRPGTGKTLTAMYLAAQMHGRTAVMLTGQSLGAVGASIDLATALQPSMVILEDVDLVAMDRSHEPTNAILFELLERHGRPGRGPRPAVRPHHEPSGSARARTRGAAAAHRPGGRAAAPGRRGPPAAARALWRRPAAGIRRGRIAHRLARGSQPGVHPRVAAACRPARRGRVRATERSASVRSTSNARCKTSGRARENSPTRCSGRASSSPTTRATTATDAAPPDAAGAVCAAPEAPRSPGRAS